MESNEMITNDQELMYKKFLPSDELVGYIHLSLVKNPALPPNYPGNTIVFRVGDLQNEVKISVQAALDKGAYERARSLQAQAKELFEEAILGRMATIGRAASKSHPNGLVISEAHKMTEAGYGHLLNILPEEYQKVSELLYMELTQWIRGGGEYIVGQHRLLLDKNENIVLMPGSPPKALVASGWVRAKLFVPE